MRMYTSFRWTWILLLAFASSSSLAQVKNVFLFVGDGMGFEHIRATALYFEDRETLIFDEFPSQARMSTDAYGGEITDSAASATAMGTGIKTRNGYVGRDPQARDVENIFSLVKKTGRRTGIVTDVSISHATPAGFAAHADHRTQTNRIVDSMLSRSRPNVLFGSALEINADWARFKGYQVAESRDQLRSLGGQDNRPPYVSGQFGTHSIPWPYESHQNLPRLPEMLDQAIELLTEQNDQGFFVMVEAGKIDWAAHGENLHGVVHEVRELERAVQRALAWAQDRDDTLIVVTADHETGGLDILGRRGQGQLPEHRWTGPDAGTGNVGHTSRVVPVYAWGASHEEFRGEFENTEIFHKLRRIMKF